MDQIEQISPFNVEIQIFEPSQGLSYPPVALILAPNGKFDLRGAYQEGADIV